MKLNVRTFQLRAAAGLLGDLEKQLTPLQELVPITTAHVLLGKYRDRNPPFCAAVHLEVPGPDIYVAGSDHTLAAAIQKVSEELRQQILLRHGHRQQQRKPRLKVRREPISF
jgi:ribosome-associated translation inhibitor RaiA